MLDSHQVPRQVTMRPKIKIKMPVRIMEKTTISKSSRLVIAPHPLRKIKVRLLNRHLLLKVKRIIQRRKYLTS